jgi:hypothetical protein
MKRLARMMAALYPAAWKKRYGDELDALIEDAGGGWHIIFDLLKEAMKMQLKTWSSGKLALVFGISGLLAAAAVTSMSILLLIAWLGSFMVLMAAVCFFNDGKSRLARRILLWWSISAAFYLTVLIAVAAMPNDSTFKMGVPYCDDDWCMCIERINKTATPAGFSYELALRLSSLANHGPRSAKGAWIYLADERNRRFLPVPDSSAIPFDAAIQPHGSVDTSLTFHVPSDARTLFFAGGLDGIRYASFIIGNGDLLHKPRLKLRIQ